jgi:hypothetical protein
VNGQFLWFSLIIILLIQSPIVKDPMELRLTIQEILLFKASNGSSVKPVKVKFDVFFVYFLTCFEMVTENKYFGYKE